MLGGLTFLPHPLVVAAAAAGALLVSSMRTGGAEKTADAGASMMAPAGMASGAVRGLGFAGARRVGANARAALHALYHEKGTFSRQVTRRMCGALPAGFVVVVVVVVGAGAAVAAAAAGTSTADSIVADGSGAGAGSSGADSVAEDGAAVALLKRRPPYSPPARDIVEEETSCRLLPRTSAAAGIQDDTSPAAW